jgi:Spy/CpxP family protein refolding chaperone
MPPALPLAAALLLLALPVAAQGPYAGQQARSIKALSAEQVADLRAGRGMGLALPAELNGWPGPMHVLELADQLGLDAAQRAAVQAQFAAMRSEAVAQGEAVIAAEAALDALFARGAPTPETVGAATLAVGQAQAALRAVHLRFHLATTAVLTPAQRARYGELRGYAATQAPAPGHHHQRHRHGG